MIARLSSGSSLAIPSCERTCAEKLPKDRFDLFPNCFNRMRSVAFQQLAASDGPLPKQVYRRRQRRLCKPSFLATIAETRQLSKEGRRTHAPPFEVSAVSPTSREWVASARCTCAFLEGCSLLPAHSVRRRGGQMAITSENNWLLAEAADVFFSCRVTPAMLACLSARFAMPVRRGGRSAGS